jgi:hypothetical protein
MSSAKNFFFVQDLVIATGFLAPLSHLQTSLSPVGKTRAYFISKSPMKGQPWQTTAAL